MLIYQLLGKGRLTCFDNDEFKVFSKNVFKEKKDAEDHIEEFSRLCCDDSINPLYCCDRNTLSVMVIELILN